MCSPQVDPGAEEARKGSEFGEVAADPVQILRLSFLGIRGVGDDPEDSLGLGCAFPDVDFNVEDVEDCCLPVAYYIFLLRVSEHT